MSLYERVVLTEYGGIGGRIAGGRHPYSVPPSNVIVKPEMTPEQADKIKRREERRRETREYLRKIALEAKALRLVAD